MKIRELTTFFHRGIKQAITGIPGETYDYCPWSAKSGNWQDVELQCEIVLRQISNGKWFKYRRGPGSMICVNLAFVEQARTGAVIGKEE